MTTATTGIGLKRLQHLVLWVSDVAQSVRFYRDVLGFEVKSESPRRGLPEDRRQLRGSSPRAVRAVGGHASG